MVSRELPLPDRTCFLFGPRQTGKSTWLKALNLPNAWMISLLSHKEYFHYLRNPAVFSLEAQAKYKTGLEWIILDEIQRVPGLLEEVHLLLETTSLKFILSGSSARKLKRSGANLLGGRALNRQMFPFTVKELGPMFSLDRALQWGTLPPVQFLSDPDAKDTLDSYTEIYLREEIQMEGLARNIGGFTRFLDLAASYAGEILNYSSLAKEVGLPIKTVQSYYEVLEDTLIALRLPAWTKSPLKRLVAHPKVYLFDNGVTNALTHRLSAPLEPRIRGHLFEQFLIQETHRRIHLSKLDMRLYFWRTNNGAEVDLLIEKNGSLYAAVEFKARSTVSTSDLSGLRSFREDHPQVPCFLVCEADHGFQLDFAQVLSWRNYLEAVLT